MPPFKADVVGSLLRPPAIHAARQKHAEGKISAHDLWEIETDQVREAVALQKAAGLHVCSDGEFHRRHWFLDFLERIDGVEVHGGLTTKFHNEQGDVEFAPPRFEVHGRVKRSQGLAVDEFKSLAAI